MHTTHQPAQASFFEKRKGAIVVLFAILLPVQMIFLGFTIDFANMHRVRNEARVIADLSSKAAADALARSGGDEDLAIATAQAVAASNTIGGVLHSLDPSEIARFAFSQIEQIVIPTGQWGSSLGTFTGDLNFLSPK